MKKNMKKMFVVAAGVLALSSAANSGELGATTPQIANLSQYLRLNGTGTARDMETVPTGVGFSATYHNVNGTGSNFIPGKVNTAMQFDGVDDFVGMSWHNAQPTYTVMFWVKRDYLTTGTSTLFQRGDATTCMYNPGINLDNATGRISVSESGCSGTGLIGTAFIGSDQFHHVAVTRSATAVSIYVNGALIKSLAKNNFPGGYGPMFVGAQYASPGMRNFFKGAIDDVAVFNTALTNDEIKTIYRDQSPQFAFGTFEKPFLPDSYWNSKPVDPVLGTVGIPNIYSWFPTVSEGDYSSSIYNAALTDPEMKVTSAEADANVASRVITIPHWPAGVTPAKGGDAHADIVDMNTGIIHSFWQLKKHATTGAWSAASYTHTKIRATGWGNPAHSQAGARAAGVVTMAGMIRTHEIEDGNDKYNHALALSIDGDTFLKNTNNAYRFEFPATAEDNNSKTAYTKVDGYAMGSLLMLPKDFNVASIKLPRLQKVARTLMTYGAYVVDQNKDTPFSIYVQNGSNYSNNPGFTGSWDNTAAADLRTIQHALRKVVSNSGYVDANGNNFVPNKKMNLLSMRGQWTLPNGAYSETVGATFNSYKQALTFPDTAKGLVLNNYWNNGILKTAQCGWTCRKPGVSYRFKVKATNGAKMVFKIRNAANTAYIMDSGMLGDGEYKDFIMPSAADNVIYLQAVNGTIGASEISGEIIEN